MTNYQNNIGKVVSLFRYPVKSMMGEELNASDVTQYGLLGDRAYALVDGSDGKIASAKNPRKWPNLFDFRAAFIDTPQIDEEIPSVRIILPDGTSVTSEQSVSNSILSNALHRQVTLNAIKHIKEKVGVSAEEYWPDIEELDYQDTVTDFNLPEDTFFDSAFLHLITTATIDRPRELYPEGRFEARRYRPNIVIEPLNDKKDFIENDWMGRTLLVGDEVQISITSACPRCVMTTLAQGDLPKDLGILRTAAQNNKGNVGVYASVIKGGTIHRGDTVRLE